MNDAQIRENFHKIYLGRFHTEPNVLVVDELGLIHGKGRADIVVINGRLIGYEIKSDDDSLDRLREQVLMYNSIFDRNTIVVGEKHVKKIRSKIPKSWGIVVSSRQVKNNVTFTKLRSAGPNKQIKPYALAQLLWSKEAASILKELGEPSKILRQPRSELYKLLAVKLSLTELRREVRRCLKSRKNWRSREPQTPNDDLFRPTAM